MPTLRYLVVLAIGQNIGWGSVGLLTVLGAEIAAGLDISLPLVFAGSSLFYVTMGLCAPFMAPAFIRYGARNLLAGGSMGVALGFAALAVSQDPISYGLGWAMLGLAGSACLSTAAHIALNEFLGAKAGGVIGALMVASGLSGTIFWPITAFLTHVTDWRMICLIYALLSALAAALYFFGLPGKQANAAGQPASIIDATPVPPMRSTFYLVAGAISLNAFVTFGFSGIIVELLKSYGLTLQVATAFASSLGIIQISARAIHLLGPGHWDGLWTALFAGPILLLSLLLLLLLPEPSMPAIVAFVLIYGFGSGALAISRATMPLVFYDRADYARAASRIALPLNLLSAAAPPALIALLDGLGSAAVLTISILCSGIALMLLVLLHFRRPV